MQLLQGTRKPRSSVEESSAELLDAVPLVMWFIRRNMRERKSAGLSVPQFRALCTISGGECGSMSEVAVNLGACLPTTSRIVTGLVAKGLVRRDEAPGDRRCRRLVLTPGGRRALDTALQDTRSAIEQELSKLSETQCQEMTRTFKALGKVFAVSARAGANGAADEIADDADCQE